MLYRILCGHALCAFRCFPISVYCFRGLLLFRCSIVSLVAKVPIVDSCVARYRLLCGHYAEVAYELLFAPEGVPNNHVFTQMSYI